jgi:O-antigen ligase
MGQRLTAADLAVRRSSATPLPPWLVTGAALGIAVAVGGALAFEVPLGLALLVGAFYAPIVMFAPMIGLALFVPLVFLEGLPAFNAGGKAAGVLIAVAWVGMLQTGRLHALDVVRAHRRLFEALALLLIWLFLTSLWAEEPSAVLGDMWHWVAVALVFAIFATTVQDRDGLRLILMAFVVGAVLSVVIGFAFGLVNTGSEQATVESSARLEGAAGDPNFLAAGVVSAVVLAAGLLVTARQPLVKLGLVGAIAIMATGLVASQSRGGILAVLVVIVAAFVFFRRRRAHVAVMALMLIGVAAVFFSATPDAFERLTTATNGGSGRSGLWTVAGRAYADHPVVGVGLNNFSAVASDYTRQPGALQRVQRIAEQPTVVHNLYLQQLTETGVIGFLLLMVVIGAALVAAWRAGQLAERQGDGDLEVLARAVLVANLGMLAASFFISDAVDRRVRILLALGPAALAIARRGTRSGGQPAS